jgi:two-component system cell cycle response regulator CpdR
MLSKSSVVLVIGKSDGTEFELIGWEMQSMLAKAPVVLVVDDEERIRTVITDVLEDGGYDVISAGSGDEAFKILEEVSHVDLIVTDVKMPGEMNGFDLIETAIASLPKVKTIIMSGYPGQDSRRVARADCFLQKPFTLGSLQREVKTLLAA